MNAAIPSSMATLMFSALLLEVSMMTGTFMNLSSSIQVARYANDAADCMGGVPCVFNDWVFEFNRQVQHVKKNLLDGIQNRIDVLNLQDSSLSGCLQPFVDGRRSLFISAEASKT
jgi:hypothetical protein